MEKDKEYLKQKKTRITITKTETIPTQMSNDKVVEVKVDSKDNNDIVKNTKTTKQQKGQNRKTKKKNTAKYNTGRPVLKSA